MDNYLHIHPTIQEMNEVQLLLQVQFCQSETEEDEPEEQPENEESLKMRRRSKYEHSLSFETKIGIKQSIKEANTKLANRVINENEYASEAVIDRITEFGAEMHEDLFLSDHKEFHDYMTLSLIHI